MCRSCSDDGRQFLLAADANAGSGAFLEYLFRAAAEAIHGVSLWGHPLVYSPGRNPDIAEVHLDRQPSLMTSQSPQSLSQPPTGTGTSVVGDTATNKKLCFAKAYGFRNIQGVVLKMKQVMSIQYKTPFQQKTTSFLSLSSPSFVLYRASASMISWR